MTADQTNVVNKPKYSVSEKNDELVVKLALPGVNKEEIEVSTEGSVLKVEANRNKKISESWTLISSSEAPSQYRLALEINQKYDLSNGNANFEKNVLTLSFVEKTTKQRTLEVK